MNIEIIVRKPNCTGNEALEMKALQGQRGDLEKSINLHFHIFPAEDIPISIHIYTYKPIFITFVIPSDSMAVKCFNWYLKLA